MRVRRLPRTAADLSRPAIAALAFVCALSLAPHAAVAETRVSGGADAVRVEARDASLEEVFGALAAKFIFQYRAKVPLDRPVNGAFSGSLSRVIARLLADYDHVVKRGPGGMEVLILGVSTKSSAPGAAGVPL
jgi:hypothetical protein